MDGTKLRSPLVPGSGFDPVGLSTDSSLLLLVSLLFDAAVESATEEAGNSAATGLAQASTRSPRAGPEPTRILVVDDDPQALRYVRNALSAANYAPAVTGDPQEVARLLKTKKPQLVLLDLLLPGTDGIELMQRVPAMADLPVIFISGYGRDETIARALETGADDYIVKPFSPTELVARVQAALRRPAGPEPFLLGDLGIHYEQRRVSMAGRPAGAADGHRIRAAPRALAQRGTGSDLRCPPAPGVERAGVRRPEGGARLREDAPPQAGR